MSYFFKKYQNLIVASSLFALALSVYSSNIRSDNPSFFERLILNICSPPLSAIAFLFKETRRVWNEYVFLVGVQKKNLELQRSIDLLIEQNMRMKGLLLENSRLRKLLSLKNRSSVKLVSAEIIGRDPLGWFKTVIINKGISSGIKRNQAVTTHQGLVGRILGVAEDSSKVLLITDINSSVDALVQRTRARGVVEGRASNLCEFKYVSSSEDVRPGDLVVTSGLCDIFPKGLTIGRVSRVEKGGFDLFQHVELIPSARLNRLEEVCVLFPE